MKVWVCILIWMVCTPCLGQSVSDDRAAEARERLQRNSPEAEECQRQYDFCFGHRVGEISEAWPGQEDFYSQDCSYDHKLCLRKMVGEAGSH